MIDSTAQTTDNAPKTKQKSFTPIGQLMKDSWERVKRTWKQIIVLYLAIVAFFVVAIFGAIAFFAAAGFAGADSPEQIAGLIAGGSIALIIFFILAVSLSTVIQAAILLAVSEAKEYPSIGSRLKRGLQLFLPLFLVSMLTTFLVFGGLGIFIIPGIVISILTSYTLYEVVFTENRMTNAIRNSVTIIQQNFGELVGRIGVIFLISIGISIVLNLFQSSDETGFRAIGGLINMVVQPVFTLFSLAYYYQTYKEAREMTDFNRPSSIVWIWVVSILGWVLGVFLIFTIAKYAGPSIEEALKSEFNSSPSYSQDQYEMIDEEVSNLDANSFIDQFGDDMTEEQKAAFKESMEKTQKMMMEDEQAAQNDSSI